jgi:lipopolysaccharide export system permease protein
MIISRYLIKEIFNALFSVAFVMLLIFLSNQLIRYLKYAANGKIAASVVMQLMGLEIPYLLVLLLPLGLFLGILFAYGRLYAENEMRVMQACGLSTKRLLMITTSCSMFVGLIVMVLAFWVNPYLAAEKDKLLKKSVATENILDILVPGRFQVSSDDNRVVYVESIDTQHKGAKNLFIAEQRKNPENTSANAWSVLSAAKGYQLRDQVTKDRFVVATDGYRYEGAPGQMEYKIIQFKKYAVRIADQVMGSGRQVEESMPTQQLWDTYQNNKSAAELQWRFSMPLSAILLALLAVPLSHLKPRQSRYARIFPALLIYIIYLNLLFVMRDRIEQAILPSYMGVWMVHALLIGVIMIAYHRHTFSLLTIFKPKKWQVSEVKSQ